ncbi:MAG: inner membrane CreD family protein, partial [Desulfobacterales bacterium]
YLLVGSAIIIFYTLLISISEHLNFRAAYLISSIAVIILLTGYARSILKQVSLAVTVCCLLLILYGYFYLLLELENYALLMGSIGLFAVLSVVMFITRKIDWYSVSFDE